MFTKIIDTLRPELSGARAFQHVEQIASHHRIQASPGYRAAANYCNTALAAQGVPARISAYPANERTNYWSQLMWQEWECTEASLDLVLPKQTITLADFAECPISLIQRSSPTPPGGVMAEVIVLDRGDDEEHYEHIDFSNRLVLTDGDLNKVRGWAVEKKGAIGILSDRLNEFPPVRHRFDIPDARQYTSFWWTGAEKRCFGFVLSPKLGDLVRKHAAKALHDHAKDPAQAPYVRVHALVKSAFYDGHIENVEAVIEGETDSEILIVAHLCHPYPSANDNASGAGVAMETMRALRALIESGKLPRPRRTIRMLLVPEMTGTYAYLATNPVRATKTLAAINLDMVGEKQELCMGPLVAEYPPGAAGSFVGDVLAAILSDVGQEVKNLAGTGSYALFKYTTSPFSGGSDHYILSDPSVNIPCPMLIQWPDKYYHTSEDTMDKVDPQMLYRVGLLSGTYAYFLACLDEASAPFVLDLCSRRHLERLQGLLCSGLQSISQEIQPMRPQVDHLLAQTKRQLLSLSRFVADGQVAAQIESAYEYVTEITSLQWARYQALTQDLKVPADSIQESVPVPGEDKIPSRKYPGPLSLRGHIEKLSLDAQAEYEALNRTYGSLIHRLGTHAVYWVDGTRTIGEISNLVLHELGQSNTALLVEYFTCLSATGLISLK